MNASPTNTELDALLRQYTVAFPHAESPMANAMNFGPECLCDILREANGRGNRDELPRLGPGRAGQLRLPL